MIFLSTLGKTFDYTDNGEVTRFLGIEIDRRPEGIPTSAGLHSRLSPPIRTTELSSCRNALQRKGSVSA